MREPRSFAKAAIAWPKSRRRLASWPCAPPSPACVSQPPTSVKATSSPTSDLMSCAICLSELPNGLFGIDPRRSPACSFAGSADLRIRTASKDSFAVPPSVPATASAYIDSKDPTSAPLGRSGADAELRRRSSSRPRRREPARMRGSAGESATARSGDDVSVLLRRDRAREEPVLRRLHARRARLHEVLRVEVRPRRVGAADGVHERRASRP